MSTWVLAGHLVLVNKMSVWEKPNMSKSLQMFIPMSGEPGGRKYSVTGVVGKEKKMCSNEVLSFLVIVEL